MDTRPSTAQELCEHAPVSERMFEDDQHAAEVERGGGVDAVRRVPPEQLRAEQGLHRLHGRIQVGHSDGDVINLVRPEAHSPPRAEAGENVTWLLEKVK